GGFEGGHEDEGAYYLGARISVNSYVPVPHGFRSMRPQALVPDSVQDSAEGVVRRAWSLLLAAAARRRGDRDPSTAGHDVALQWLTGHGSQIAVAANVPTTV